jgi:hypothetical protein
MRKGVWAGLLLGVSALLPMMAHGQETAAGCDASVENAEHRLKNADDDPAEALKAWLRACPSNPDARKKFTAAIEQAIPAVMPEPSDPAPKNAPPQNYRPPFGRFAQHGHKDFDDRSGWFEWDDTLVIRKDGTAEIISRYKVNFYTGWYLKGCRDGMREGSDVWTMRFQVLFDATTATFYRQGPIEVSDVEPSCWQHSERFKDPRHMRWIDGHLTDGDGEYVRQE